MAPYKLGGVGLEFAFLDLNLRLPQTVVFRLLERLLGCDGLS